VLHAIKLLWIIRGLSLKIKEKNNSLQIPSSFYQIHYKKNDAGNKFDMDYTPIMFTDKT